MLTIVQLQDVPDQPKIKTDLPGPLRIGDPVRLPPFRISRRTPEGRHEQLVVDMAGNRFRVTAIGLDSSQGPPRQLISVENAMGQLLAWKAVKKPAEPRKRLSPTIFPRTPV